MFNIKNIKKVIPLTLVFLPSTVNAATTLETIIDAATDVVVLVVPGLITLALAIFIWGVIKYITAGDSEEGRSKARNTIIYGVIGLFAIVAVWGLVQVLGNTFDITIGGGIDIPQF